MKTAMTALEMTGTIDENRQLHLDELLPFSGPRRVRIIVLYPSHDEWDDAEWLYAAAHNPAFDFLHEPEENVYTVEDGKPFAVTLPDDCQNRFDSERVRPITFKNPDSSQSTSPQII